MDKTKTAVDLFNKYASSYQDKFMNVDLYGDTFDTFCEAVAKQDGEVLELACGPGNITKYLLNKRPGFKILGTDLAPNMIELAQANNSTAQFKLMDCRNMLSLQKKYDAIMCGFCLPYLSKEETQQLLADAYSVLNPKGVLYISTMEDDYSKSGLRKGSGGEEIFMHYYQAADLINYLEAQHFNMIDLQRKQSIMTDGTVVIDLVIIAQR